MAGLIRPSIAKCSSISLRTCCFYKSYSSHRPILDSSLVLARDLYDENQHIHIDPVTNNKLSLYPKSVLEPRNERNVHRMRHQKLRLVLEGNNKQFEQMLTGRAKKLQNIIGQDYMLLTKEAIVILCGLSESSINFAQHSEVFYDSSKLREIGKNIYDITKQTLLIFGDLQHLSASWQELSKALNAVNDDNNNIPQFMKTNLMHDLIIPFRGSTKGYSHLLDPEIFQNGGVNELTIRQQKVKDASSIGSFYTLIGLLVVKYGRERIIESFLVPRVFNGKSGIIEIITSGIEKG